MRGRVVTKEQREVLRLANLGKKQSKETINKRANKLRGMKRSKKVGEEISKRQRVQIIHFITPLLYTITTITRY
jgi:DNA-directed RNA polymerase alpha subunit